eukprot:jgi/Mesen1/1869/ME000143S00916
MISLHTRHGDMHRPSLIPHVWPLPKKSITPEAFQKALQKRSLALQLLTREVVGVASPPPVPAALAIEHDLRQDHHGRLLLQDAGRMASPSVPGGAIAPEPPGTPPHPSRNWKGVEVAEPPSGDARIEGVPFVDGSHSGKEVEKEDGDASRQAGASPQERGPDETSMACARGGVEEDARAQGFGGRGADTYAGRDRHGPHEQRRSSLGGGQARGVSPGREKAGEGEGAGGAAARGDGEKSGSNGGVGVGAAERDAGGVRKGGGEKQEVEERQRRRRLAAAAAEAAAVAGAAAAAERRAHARREQREQARAKKRAALEARLSSLEDQKHCLVRLLKQHPPGMGSLLGPNNNMMPGGGVVGPMPPPLGRHPSLPHLSQAAVRSGAFMGGGPMGVMGGSGSSDGGRGSADSSPHAAAMQHAIHAQQQQQQQQQMKAAAVAASHGHISAMLPAGGGGAVAGPLAGGLGSPYGGFRSPGGVHPHRGHMGGAGGASSPVGMPPGLMGGPRGGPGVRMPGAWNMQR